MSRTMKDSGIPWLKDIPLNWDVERGKNVLVLQKRPVRDNDEVVTCFRDGEVVLRNLRRVEGFTMSDKEIGYQGINQGDIVIHGMDGFAGAMGVSKSTGKGSPVLVVCTPKYDAIPQYLIYYLRALAITDVFVALATGIRERSCDLRWNKISELEFILPPSSEQHLIATFLDKKCSEIDSLIELQEQMIEELKAYKQSVITEAVTKGLNPNVPMKDSGIEWIGDVPEGWEVKRLKQESVFINGFAFDSEDFKVDEGVRVIRIGDIGLRADFESCVRAITNPYILTPYRIENGDILIAMSGATTGKCCIVDEVEEAYINQRVGIIRSNLCKIIYYSLQTPYFMEFVNLNNAGSAQPNISSKAIGEFPILLPPLAEQQAIADYLDKKCGEIDELITIKQQKIESLKEYKKSVIYEYVTGKREV